MYPTKIQNTSILNDNDISKISSKLSSTKIKEILNASTTEVQLTLPTLPSLPTLRSNLNLAKSKMDITNFKENKSNKGIIYINNNTEINNTDTNNNNNTDNKDSLFKKFKSNKFFSPKQRYVSYIDYSNIDSESNISPRYLKIKDDRGNYR